MKGIDIGRRHALAASTLALVPGLRATAGVVPDGDFAYEIRRTKEEWRAALTDQEYAVLRLGGTEPRHSSELRNETRDGTYRCRGCELAVYAASWKAQVDKGWVFFEHAEPNSVLTAIDGPVAEYGQAEMDTSVAMMEVHCRRCGSHLGHYVPVDGRNLHCINGLSLRFEPG